MMFSKEDFKIDNFEEFLEFVPVFIFIAFVAPFLIAAYKLGFLMDVTGFLKKTDYPK
jgi:hypothetical protein